MQPAVTATVTPSATDVYALGRDPGESARLQRQSEELRRICPAMSQFQARSVGGPAARIRAYGTPGTCEEDGPY